MLHPLEIIDQPEDRPRPPPALQRSPSTSHQQYHRLPFADVGRNNNTGSPATNSLAAAHDHPKQPPRPHSIKSDVQSRSRESPPIYHNVFGSTQNKLDSGHSSPSTTNRTMANGYGLQPRPPPVGPRTHPDMFGNREDLDTAILREINRKNGVTKHIEDTSKPRSQLELVHPPTNFKRPRDDTDDPLHGPDTQKRLKHAAGNAVSPHRPRGLGEDAKPIFKSHARPIGSREVIDVDAHEPRRSSAFVNLLSDEEEESTARSQKTANASPFRKSAANSPVTGSPSLNKPHAGRPISNATSPSKSKDRLFPSQNGGSDRILGEPKSLATARDVGSKSPAKRPGFDTVATDAWEKAGMPTVSNSTVNASNRQTHDDTPTSLKGAFTNQEPQMSFTSTQEATKKNAFTPIEDTQFRVPEVPSAKPLEHSQSTLPLASKVERVLGKYVEELRTNTEHWNRAWLRRARCSRKKQDVINELAVNDQPYSFANYPAIQAPTKLSGPTNKEEVIFVEVQRGPAKIAKANFAIPVTHFTSVDKMPSYTHYVHIQNNFLALNETIMHYQPYFSEEFDEAEAANMRQHYFYDAAPRPRKLLQLSQAQSYDDFITSALRDLDITWADVLRFFLEEQPDVGNEPDAIRALRERQTFCEEDFAGRSAPKYVRLLASLPSSTPFKTATAATVCEGFAHMAKLSLWHIARIHLHDYMPPTKPKDMSIEKMTCRICFRYDCPIHGEIKQVPENDGEGDVSDEDENDSEQLETNEAIATDIIHPPKINYRTRIAFTSSASGQPQQAEPRARGQAAHSTYQWKPEDRQPFYPCHHPGRSCEDEQCRCFLQNIHCEKSCTCSPACHRRFPGCKCYHEVSMGKEYPGRKTMCFQDERCLCFRSARECDPDLCGPCRVCDILDPINLDDDKILVGRCRNASIQRGVTKHTLLGESAIHGFGLYAGDDIKAHDFIGEYKGEIITRDEAERRGAMYEHQKLSYLFNLNMSQEIDSTYFGNKIRFINHAGNGKNNLYPRLVLVNTVHRIALYGARSVKKGYELFFDYGPLFPEAQLGKAKKDTPLKNARNNAGRTSLLDDFYDVGYSEDEKGNYRARKVAGSRSRPAKSRQTAKKPRKPKVKPLHRETMDTGASTPLEQAASASSSSLQLAKAPSVREDDELSRIDPAERIMSYNIADDDGVSEEDDDDDDDDEVAISRRLAAKIEQDEDEDEDYRENNAFVEEEDEDDLPYDDDEDEDGPPVKRRHRPVKKR